VLSERLHERLQAALFAVLDIQVLWSAPVHQATFAPASATPPGVIADLLNRAGGGPGPALADPAVPGAGPTGSEPVRDWLASS
jgi:hypothetical protein